MGESPFLTVQEAAGLLRVPVSRMYEWTRQVGADVIPCYRGGKRLLFDREEVLLWFRQTQRKEVPPAIHARRRRVPARRSRTTPRVIRKSARR